MNHFARMQHLIALLLLCLTAAQAGWARTISVADRSKTTDQRVRQFFAGGTLPFSFKLDGQSSDKFLGQWKRQLSKPQTDGENRLRYTLTLTSPAKQGLELRADIVAYDDFPAVEWTLHFTNRAQRNSPRLSDVCAADITLSDQQKSPFTYYTAQGCNAVDRDFHLIYQKVEADTTYRFVPTGGRPSSLTAFPFYNIATDHGQGVFFSIGWTGTWFAEFAQRAAGQLSVRSGMRDCDLFLLPGESIRTPLVSLLYWAGEDRIDGNNAFRRFVLAHHSPKVDGKTIKPPFCGGFDYGDAPPCNEYEAFTELLGRATIERHERFGLHPEVYWLDAGWYEGCNAPQSAFEGRSWYNTVGSWVPDPNRFPNGLKPLSDAIHAAGAKFMLWLEPERVYQDSRWHKEHPDWLLSHKDSKSYLLNIGRPEVCDFLCKYIADFMEKNGVDHYRQDFNINPVAFWAAADSAGRRGITEIRYIEGLYRFWDYLMAKFPSMYIDNCASGGRRFDLETIGRSIPLWRTDCHYGEPTCQQCHTYGLAQFLPIHGTGIYFADNYCSRSGMSSAYGWFGEVFSRKNAVTDLQNLFDTYLRLRHYFLCDFYPLSGDGDQTGLKRWVAWQYHDSKTNSGIIQVFRRDEATEKSKVYSLRGLDPNTLYDVYNEDNKITVSHTGAELMKGIPLYLPDPRTSLLLTYCPAQK